MGFEVNGVDIGIWMKQVETDLQVLALAVKEVALVEPHRCANALKAAQSVIDRLGSPAR